MLRLKDLFKIDFSSKGGGKLADKIFNKYNITREEREEVKNEIVNGGGGGDTGIKYEYEYLKVNAFEIGFSEVLPTLKAILSFYYFTIYRRFRDHTIDNEYIYAEITNLDIISDRAVYIKTIKNIYPNILSWSDYNGEIFNVEKYKELLGMPNLDVNLNNFLKLNVVENPELGEEVYNKYFSIPTKEEIDEVIANTRYKYPLY